MLDLHAVEPCVTGLAWGSGLPELNAGSGMVAAVSSFLIALAIATIVRRRGDAALYRLGALFAAVFVAAGVAHLAAVWTAGSAEQLGEGAVKAAAALLAAAAAAALWWNVPGLLARPSSRRLAEANRALEAEIAERRRMEARLTGFFDHLGEALHVVTVAGDGRFLFDTVNPAHARAFAVDPGSVSGRAVEEVLPAALAEPALANYRACLAAGGPVDFEQEMALPAGAKTWHMVLVPIRDASGTIVQILGSGRDVTERRRLQGDLIRASRLATLGTVAAGMAHEISQPLNIIRIWTESALDRIAREGIDGERVRRVLALVVEQTERMGGILDRIRLFSRRDGSDADEFDPVASVVLAVELLRNQYALEGVEIAVASEPVPSVAGHPHQLEQVILSLLSNARDAIRDRHLRTPSGPHGLIAVAVRPTGGGVRIAVSDNGGGIPPETLPHVFDPFFSTKDVGKGTGLGLSVGFGIVESMKGRIEAVNVVHPDGDRGTRITIDLPAVPVLAPEEAGHDR
jgi:PAS domain S-box-containing protein